MLTTHVNIYIHLPDLYIFAIVLYHNVIFLLE